MDYARIRAAILESEQRYLDRLRAEVAETEQLINDMRTMGAEALVTAVEVIRPHAEAIVADNRAHADEYEAEADAFSEAMTEHMEWMALSGDAVMWSVEREANQEALATQAGVSPALMMEIWGEVAKQLEDEGE